MKNFITIPFLLLLATYRGESLYIPRDDPLSAPKNFKPSLITRQSDGCANIHNAFIKAGTKEGLSFPFSDIKSCYESFAFDDQRRTDTIDTMKKVLNGFYSFVEQAKEQPAQGFDFSAIDIISEIDNLSQKEYANDFEFTSDATNVVTELKDPHTLFFPICYTRFSFTQRIVLYSTVSDNGMQMIKVFKDSTEPGNDDCDVEQIDGVAAIDAIKEFARDKVFVSKDLGVRFNLALGSLALQNGTYLIQPRSSQFTLRILLPEKESTTYELKCGDSTKTITRNWEAVINNPDDLDKFTDSGSYWQNFCANPPAGEPKSPQEPPNTGVPSAKNPQRKSKKSRTSKSHKSHNVAYPIDPLTVNPELLKELSPPVDVGKPVFDAKIAQFYTLENNVGVAVLSTFDIGNDLSPNSLSDTFNNLQTGFKTLMDNGAKKLVLDLSNNEGGLTIVAHFVNSILFPNANPSLPSDFRLNDIIKSAVVKASDNNTEATNSIFNIGGYLSVDGQTFNSTSEFFQSKYIENDLETINGFISASKTSTQWSANDMIILTNGFCGSSCTATSLLLSQLHGVQTVAVGGFPNVPLSFSSFPGGQAFLLEDPLKRGFDLKTDFGALGLTNETDFPKDLPTNTMLTFTVRRAFSVINPDEVLEYSFIPSTNHIFFDGESIRNPSKLWTQASTLI